MPNLPVFKTLFIMVSALVSGEPSYEAQFDHLLAVRSWASYLTSPSCSLLIHETNDDEFVRINMQITYPNACHIIGD